MEHNLETVTIQVTTSCPYKCPQCYMAKGEAFIPLEMAKEKIDISHKFGAMAVQMTGGEPILYPYLNHLIEYATKKGMFSFLSTSGFEHSKSKYSKLKESGLSLICVSLNGILEEHNATTRNGFHESISAIQDAVLSGLPCYVNVVVSDDNIKQLQQIAYFLKTMGVAGVCVLRPFPSNDNQYIPSVSKETIVNLQNIVKENVDFIRVENCFKEYWEYGKAEVFKCCDQGNRVIFVNVNGTISPCSKKMNYRYETMCELQARKYEWETHCCGCDQ